MQKVICPYCGRVAKYVDSSVMGRCGRDRCAAGFACHCDRAYDSTEHHLDQAQRQIRHLGRKADGCVGEQPRIPQAAVGT